MQRVNKMVRCHSGFTEYARMQKGKCKKMDECPLRLQIPKEQRQSRKDDCLFRSFDRSATDSQADLRIEGGRS
jgi:hypothetical protein